MEYQPQVNIVNIRDETVSMTRWQNMAKWSSVANLIMSVDLDPWNGSGVHVHVHGIRRGLVKMLSTNLKVAGENITRTSKPVTGFLKREQI
jgi:hypothetical protein